MGRRTCHCRFTLGCLLSQERSLNICNPEWLILADLFLILLLTIGIQSWSTGSFAKNQAKRGVVYRMTPPLVFGVGSGETQLFLGCKETARKAEKCVYGSPPMVHFLFLCISPINKLAAYKYMAANTCFKCCAFSVPWTQRENWVTRNRTALVCFSFPW